MLGLSSSPLLMIRGRSRRHIRLRVLFRDGRQLHRLGLYWWSDRNDGVLAQKWRLIEACLQVVPIAFCCLSPTRGPFDAGHAAAGVSFGEDIFVKSSVKKYGAKGERPLEAFEKEYHAVKNSPCPVSGQAGLGVQEGLQVAPQPLGVVTKLRRATKQPASI